MQSAGSLALGKACRSIVLLIALLPVACNDGSGTKAGPGAVCSANPEDPNCGLPCGDNADACAPGYYCSEEKLCTADCSAAADVLCGEGETCSVDGRCQPGASLEPSGNGFCADVDVAVSDIPPHVMLVLDKSGSMTENFVNRLILPPSRWDALTQVVVGEAAGSPDGLVGQLQERVRFGTTMYQTQGSTCPAINLEGTSNGPILDTDLNNYDRIAELFANATPPAGNTPTAETLRLLTRYFDENPPQEEGQLVFLLVTDGLPNGCGSVPANFDNAEEFSEGMVQRAFEAGIRTFVVGIAPANVLPSDHLNLMAYYGQGEALDPADAASAPPLFYRPNDVDQLDEALLGIVRASRSCTLSLNGSLTDLGRACEGEVRLSTDADPEGRILGCDEDDGWRAVDVERIELQGQACSDFLDSETANVAGSFPCDVVTVI